MNRSRDPPSDCQVQTILDRKVFSGKVLYLTKWKGYPPSDATWQSVKMLKPYRHLIRLFHGKNKMDADISENDQFEVKLQGIKEEYQRPQRQNQSPKLDLHVDSQIHEKEDSQYHESFRDAEESEYVEKKPEVAVPTKKRGRPKKKKDHTFDDSLQKSTGAIVKNLNKSIGARQKKPNVKFEHVNTSLPLHPPTRILFCEETAKDNVEYVIEENGQLKRCPSKYLIENYTNQLVRRLETALLRNHSSTVL